VDIRAFVLNTISYMGRSKDMAKQDVKRFIKQHEAIHEIHRHAHNKRMSMRLFMLRDKQGGRPVKDENGNVIFYSNKAVAKQNRVGNQVVSYGVDHRKFKSLEGSI